MWNSSLPSVIQKRIQPAVKFGRVLDLGPGRIWPGLRLLRDNPDLEVVGRGYSAVEASLAMDEARRLGVAGRADYAASDAAKTDLADRSVDNAVSFGAWHAWTQPVETLDEISRVLKLGGLFFLGDAGPERSWLQRLGLWHGDAALRALYAAQRPELTHEKMRTQIYYSRLPESEIITVSPDVWIVPKAA